MPFEYLACPHTHDDPIIRELRALAAKTAMVNLTKSGRNVFSPIAMSHCGDELLPGTQHSEWMRLDICHLRAASRFLVLDMQGRLDSKGVKEEFDHAISLAIPTEILSPEAWVPEPIWRAHNALLTGDATIGQLPRFINAVHQYRSMRAMLKDLLPRA